MRLNRDDMLIALASAVLLGLLVYKRVSLIQHMINPYLPYLILPAVASPLLILGLRGKSSRVLPPHTSIVSSTKGTFLVLPAKLEVQGRDVELDVNRIREILDGMGAGMTLIVTSWSGRKLLGQRLGGGTSAEILLWAPLGDLNTAESNLKATLSAINSSLEGVKLEIDRDLPLDRDLLSSLLETHHREEELRGITLSREERGELPLLLLGEHKGKEVGVPLADLTRHVLIVGQTGSGKTTTAKRLVYEAWNIGIPSLVLDIHWEYKSLIFQLGGRIFTLREGLPMICINPLSEVLNGEREMFLVAETLSNILDLTPSQFYLLMKGLKRIGDQSIGGPAPTLKDLLMELKGMNLTSQAEEESRASLIRKMEPLLVSEGAEIFGCDNLDVDELGQYPSVLDIGDVKSDTLKQLATFFILKRIKEHFVREGRKSVYPKMLVIIEEAEKLIPPYKDATGMDLVDRLFSELRKFGVSLILVAQSLTDIPEGVLRNTGIKMFHRMESPTDLRALKLLLREKKLVDMVTTLAQGECLMVSPCSLARFIVSPVEEKVVESNLIERLLRYTPFYWPKSM